MLRWVQHCEEGSKGVSPLGRDRLGSVLRSGGRDVSVWMCRMEPHLLGLRAEPMQQREGDCKVPQVRVQGQGVGARPSLAQDLYVSTLL